MDEQQIKQLRKRLLTYPGVNEANVDQEILAYEHRAELKHELITVRGFSNAHAERFLDTEGHQRPPGWGSVFCYPGSKVPRRRWIITIVLLSILAFLFLR